MLINGLYLGRQKQDIDLRTSTNEKSMCVRSSLRQGAGTRGQTLKPQERSPLIQQDQKANLCDTETGGDNIRETTVRYTILFVINQIQGKTCTTDGTVGSLK